MPSTVTQRLTGLNAAAAIKAPVRVATTANITLSGEQTVDGVAVVADDRVLVKNQTTAAENGLYLCKTTAWARAKDFDGALDAVVGTLVFVTSGTTNGNTFWRVTAIGTIGTDTVSFSQTDNTLAGVSAFVETLLDDANAGAFLTTLGITAFAQTLLDDANAGAVRSTLGVDIPPRVNELRLSLTTAVPVTTSDVTGAATIYLVPYTGRNIALYDGSAWNIRSTPEVSLALTVTSGNCYDVFAYDNAGTVTLETLAWTNATTRATALAYQDGVLVKSGAATRRYLGTVYATGTNQVDDSAAKRHLWNYYHRRARPMRVLEATNSWTYSTATLRQANAATANQLDFVIGVSEDTVEAHVVASAANDTGSTILAAAIGLDSTSAMVSGCVNGVANALVVNNPIVIHADYKALIAVGRHTLVWLEYAQASGTTTWYGDNNAPSERQSGIEGVLWG